MTSQRVLLLFGGRSAEHDVSRVSAVAVGRALASAGFDVVPVGITVDGAWLYSEEIRRALQKDPDSLGSALIVEGEPVMLRVDPQQPGLQTLTHVAAEPIAVDVVFPVLHGPFGEDGTVQGLCELADLAYVGAGIVGSAIGMDKVAMKAACVAAGLPVPRYRAFRANAIPKSDDVVNDIGLPCFVKPANLGSSIGINKAKTVAQYEAAIAAALQFDEWVIVEEAVIGREIEIAILGDEELVVSPPGEIVPGDEFYSYADKYERDDAQLLAPAPLDADTGLLAQSLAQQVYIATRASGMARIDLFLETQRADGSPGRGLLVNEINTIPGFTPISMFPRLMALTGMSYADLCTRLVELAWERHERRAQRVGRQRHEALPASQD
jgi:D-alanine--D-alanine ligase